MIFKLFSRPPLSCDFLDVGVAVSLPDSLLDILLVVRVLFVKYDHFSDLCPSWVPNPLPEEEQKGTVSPLPVRKSRHENMMSLYCLLNC
jgi:hypothetical protein